MAPAWQKVSLEKKVIWSDRVSLMTSGVLTTELDSTFQKCSFYGKNKSWSKEIAD